MKAFWITVLALGSLGSAAAQDVPPLPPLRGDAASLKDTMKFLQDKLPGKVNFIIYPHNNVAGTDLPSIKRSIEVSNMSADTDRCRIGYHVRIDNGKNTNNIVEKDNEIFLKQVREITLIPLDQLLQRTDAEAGHPERSAKVDPPIFVVVVKNDANASLLFRFYEDTLADRVSKAMQHAVELCGGGNSEPF